MVFLSWFSKPIVFYDYVIDEWRPWKDAGLQGLIMSVKT